MWNPKRRCRPLASVVAGLFLLLAPSGAMLSVAQEAVVSEAVSSYPEIDALMQSENYKEAIKTINAAQDKGDDSFELNQLLVESLFMRMSQVGMLKQKGLASKLKAAMEHSLELKPNDAQALDNLAQFHIQAPKIAGGDKAEAARLVTALKGVDPVKGHLSAALLAATDDDYEASIAELDKALAINPKNGELYEYKGVVLLLLEDYDAAMDAFTTCTLYDPENAKCSIQLGLAAKRGDIPTEDGVQAMQKYIATEPDNRKNLAYAHYHLGNLYAQTGDKSKARSHYEQAISIKDINSAKKALAALD